jgi:acyl-coenzyme A thioesterase PaaI-like protein
MSFANLLAAATASEGGFTLTVPEDWHQGRTAFGGFSTAFALHAASRAGGGELPPLRSAAVSFVGPLHGEVEARARVLRRGRNATWIGAEVLRAGEVGLTASFVFMSAAASRIRLDDRAPPAGLVPVEQARSVAPNAHTPRFVASHFEVRFALPRRAAPVAELCWWVRLREPRGLDAVTGLLLVADALPPGILPMLGPGVPVSSMTWQANLLTAAPQTRDGWWLLRSTGDFAADGCSSQRMSVWNSDGVPVMAGMQSIAVFG